MCDSKWKYLNHSIHMHTLHKLLQKKSILNSIPYRLVDLKKDLFCRVVELSK